MLKAGLPLCFVAVICCLAGAWGQQLPDGKDTFFLVKKKGLLGTLGKSISVTPSDEGDPVRKANPYFMYSGRTIRNIKIVRLGFERDINDTTVYRNSFGNIVANGLHRKTRAGVIENNLFFESGDKVNPYLFADNERHLRDQPFIQDALIVIEKVFGSSDKVDVLVMVKDVFSLGGSIDFATATRMRLDVKDENLSGTGSRLLISTFYDNVRRPRMGFGAEFLLRNLRGSFVNATLGAKSFSGAFNSGRNEETVWYATIERPLVTTYLAWVGAVDLSYNKTKNNYISDSLYRSDYNYSFQRFDGWLGYNFGTHTAHSVHLSRTRKFVAVRGLYQHFQDLPMKAKDSFDYRYSNISGVLASVNLFKQQFIRTNFIYGFGRNEDVPEGFTVSLVGGYISKRDSLSDRARRRAYYGIEALKSHFNEAGFFTNYTVRLGGYRFRNRWEDIDILLNVDHFTRKMRMGSEWYFRQFYSAGFTRQLAPTLNPPLYLSSAFGLPYFYNGRLAADMRATVKSESVFYNLRKFWGFRFAPFLFADGCLVKSIGDPISKSDLYTALGGGLRTRNENLIFGTVELRGYFFPRTMPGMSNWRAEINTNIRFKYTNIIVRKPDFIVAN